MKKEALYYIHGMLKVYREEKTMNQKLFPQFLYNEHGKPEYVLLSMKDYENIMNQLEDYQDAQIADQAYEEFTQGRPLEEALKELLDAQS